MDIPTPVRAIHGNQSTEPWLMIKLGLNRNPHDCCRLRDPMARREQWTDGDCRRMAQFGAFRVIQLEPRTADKNGYYLSY